MFKFKNKKGLALAVSMMVVAVTTILSTTYVSRAVFEKSMAEREVRSVKSFYAAEAGASAGVEELTSLINTSLQDTVRATDPAVFAAQVSAYVAANNSLGFLVAYTRNGATQLLTLSGSQAYRNGTSTPINSTSNYTYSIYITAKGNPVTVAANTWEFSYYYQIRTTGSDGSQIKKQTLNGDFTVEVRKDNFARFALFTNNQTMPDGTNVWFTNFTNFSGPMFTNGRYNFAYNPSGNFYGSVGQVDAQARFYNNGGTPVNINSDHNGTIDVPTFYDGFSRSQASISMPSSSDETAMINQAKGSGNINTDGIYVPNSGGAVTAGIYVRGDATVSMSVDGSDRAVYTISQGGTTKTITVDRAANQTIVRNVSSGATTTYTGKPDGVGHVGTILFVNGNITNLQGTVQKDTQVLIAAHSDAIIQNHIRYAQYTPAVGTPGTAGYIPPNAIGKTNLLGIMSWGGNVRIGTSAPNNLDIHGTVMAKNGIVTVDNYNSGASRGSVTLLGGVISNNYGAFGTMGAGGSLNTGYGRNFVYDARMETEATPPYFPTLSTFIAFTNDIYDKSFTQTGGF